LRNSLLLERKDPGWYTPADLPAEILAFDTAVPNLDVGSAGKVGILDLNLALSGGTTRLVHQFQQLPLYVFHPLYIDPKHPRMAFVYMLQSGEGIVQGDRYRLDLHCASGTAVHFTTQAATKIYRMEDNFATQIVNLNVGSGAFVEYLPDPTLPFRDSRFYQRILLNLDPSATVIIGETLLPGRVAHGEMHAYSLYYSEIEARLSDGGLLFSDRLRLGGGAARAASPGLLGPYTVLATLYVITRQLPGVTLVERLSQSLAAQKEVIAEISELPNNCGAFIRILGHTSITVGVVMQLAWNEARLALLNLPAPDLRKM
jgi:urease accessory protein